jgi:hypothetical protein
MIYNELFWEACNSVAVNQIPSMELSTRQLRGYVLSDVTEVIESCVSRTYQLRKKKHIGCRLKHAQVLKSEMHGSTIRPETMFREGDDEGLAWRTSCGEQQGSTCAPAKLIRSISPFGCDNRFDSASSGMPSLNFSRKKHLVCQFLLLPPPVFGI